MGSESLGESFTWSCSMLYFEDMNAGNVHVNAHQMLRHGDSYQNRNRLPVPCHHCSDLVRVRSSCAILAMLTCLTDLAVIPAEHHRNPSDTARHIHHQQLVNPRSPGNRSRIWSYSNIGPSDWDEAITKTTFANISSVHDWPSTSSHQ